jgi:peptide-methionine (R)-S-oxide reductase
MLHLRLQPWACLPIAALIGFFAPPAVPGQDPPDAAAKPGSETVPKPDGPSQTNSDLPASADEKAKSTSEPQFVYKTDAEWKKILTRNQYAVTRQKATEPAFSGRYATGHYRGTFLCVCCGAELFQAQHKFNSGTGWPSFYRPANDRALQTAVDDTGLESRVEVMCRRCLAHLGHVFDDGPAPTGLRFCINSIAIKLRPPGGEAPPKQALTKTTTSSKTKAKSKAKAKSSPKAVPRTTESPDTPNPPDSDQSPATKPESSTPGRPVSDG